MKYRTGSTQVTADKQDITRSPLVENTTLLQGGKGYVGARNAAHDASLHAESASSTAHIRSAGYGKGSEGTLHVAAARAHEQAAVAHLQAAGKTTHSETHQFHMQQVAVHARSATGHMNASK